MEFLEIQLSIMNQDTRDSPTFVFQRATCAKPGIVEPLCGCIGADMVNIIRHGVNGSPKSVLSRGQFLPGSGLEKRRDSLMFPRSLDRKCSLVLLQQQRLEE